VGSVKVVCCDGVVAMMTIIKLTAEWLPPTGLRHVAGWGRL
jgi:hypothetical protein